MTQALQRINPRRPFQVTSEGLKRIVLGETGGSSAVHVATHRDTAPKPLRLVTPATTYILVIAHSERGAIDVHAHEAIAAAALLAKPTTAVAVLVMGDLSEDLAAFGADQVYVSDSSDSARFDPDHDLAIATEIIARLNPRHIILPDNASGDLGRRLAARLDVSAAAHVVELRPDAVATHRQSGAQMARRDLPLLILLDPNTTDTALPFIGAGELRRLPALPDADTRYADLGTPPVDATQLGLEEADFIVAAGNGVSDVPMLLALAKTFDAAVGASRVAVDDGRFARDKQIGATGRTVTANVYLAVGISGAVQHLQGIRSVRHVIAINKDASAPIAGRADLTIVDDAQAVMGALLEATRARNFTPDDSDIVAAIPPTSVPLVDGEGTDRALGSLRVLTLASVGRNPVNGAARPDCNDLLALELARSLGNTTLLHAGDPNQPALGDYFAYGATTLAVIPTAEAQDIIPALASQAANHDILLTGTRSEGGEGSGLVPYLLAERLGWPIVGRAIAVTIADGQASITQALPKGQRRHVRVPLPAVIVIDPKAPFTPRYAFARRRAGTITQHAPITGVPDTSWRVEPATKRPVKFKAKEQKAGHARMLSAIVTEAKGGAVVNSGTPADKAQAILSYLRTHKLIEW